MSSGNRTPYPMNDQHAPQKDPIRLPKDSSSLSGASVIPDGRVMHQPQRRRAMFDRRRLFHRVWQVLRDPRQITWREVCWATFGGYASFQLWQMTIGIFTWALFVIAWAPYSDRPYEPFETIWGFAGDILEMVGWALVSWVRGTVVPWGLACAAVVFVGEEAGRRWRRGTWVG